MRKRTLAIRIALACVAAVSGAPVATRPDTGTAHIQLLSVSDWHGQIVPLGLSTGMVGGAAAVKIYFDQARAETPNTLTFMAGDSLGAPRRFQPSSTTSRRSAR